MTTNPQNPNIGRIEIGIREVSSKLDDLIAALPQTYETIKDHDVKYHVLEEKTADNARRLTILEAWKDQAVQAANVEHGQIRKEQEQDRKELSSAINILTTSLGDVKADVKNLTGTLKWVLYVLSGIGIGFAVAFLTHVIRF